MGIRIVKWLVYLLLLLVVLLGCALAFVVLNPDRVVGLLEYSTGYTISADTLDINPSASVLNASGLRVIAPDGSELLRAEDLSSGVDALGAWRGNEPFWDIRIRNAHVYVSPSTEETPRPDHAAAALDFSRVLAARSVDVDSLTVHVGENETTYSVSLQRSEGNVFDVQMSLGAQLVVAGQLRYELGSRNQIELTLPKLDARKLLESGSAAPEDEQASTTDSDEAAMDWAWLGMLRNTDLSLQIGQLRLPAHTVNDVQAKLAFSENGLNLDLQLASLLLDANTQINDLALQADLSALALTTQGKDLAGKLALNSEGLQLGAGGEFNINGSNGNNLELLAKLESQSGISAVVPAALAAYLPLQLETKLLVANSNYQLDNLNAKFAESDVTGSLSLALHGNAPKVYARLVSKALVVSGANNEDVAEEEVSDQPKKSSDKNNKVFSEEAITWEWLEQGEIDVELNADILQLYDAGFNDFALSAKGRQGVLTIDPLGAEFGGGGFSGSSTIKKAESGAAATLKFAMSGVDLEAFGLVPQEQLAGGKTELELELNTRGNSSAEMAGALQGKVHLLVHDAVVQNDSFELIGSDILLETLNKLNPFAKTDPTTKLHCALLHFDIDDGQMATDNALVVETEKMEIIGDGSINLDEETLDILITPNAKQTVGLNVGSVVKFMKLGGTLANPSPAVDAGGLLKSGASIGAAVSTGGVSLLAENLVKKATRENACRTALAVSQPGE